MSEHAKKTDYDLIVIGGGPGGYSSAIAAAKQGMRVMLAEGGNLGGTCLNVGCIPTKYLYDKAAVLDRIRALTKQELIRYPGEFSFRKIQEGREAVIKKLVGGVEYLLKANKVDVVRAYASVKEAGKVECGGTVYTAKNILIATGSEPSGIPIDGKDLTITSTEALSLSGIPDKMVVIGGGVIGLEIASAYRSFGSEITVIEVLPELLPKEEPAAVKYLEKQLKKRGIRIFTGTKVSAVKKTAGGLSVSYEGKENGTVDADVVLMATGRRPVIRGIDVNALGIAVTERGVIKVNEYMETSVPGIYCIGDANNLMQLAHAAFAEGEAAVAHMLGSGIPCDLSVMPRCIYTAPCFAAVGITSKQAEEMGIRTTTGSFAYSGNGMALAEGADGIVSVLMDADAQTTLGVQIVGDNASEMISAAAFAVKEALTLDGWSETIVAHPSLSEMLREAALDAFGLSVHGPVRKK